MESHCQYYCCFNYRHNCYCRDHCFFIYLSWYGKLVTRICVVSLDQCPECTQSISSKARTCNHCGYPLKGHIITFLRHNIGFCFIIFGFVIIATTTISFRFSSEYDALINPNTQNAPKGWLSKLLTPFANEPKKVNKPPLSTSTTAQKNNLTIDVNGVGVSVNLSSLKEKIKNYKATKKENTQQQTE